MIDRFLAKKPFTFRLDAYRIRVRFVTSRTLGGKADADYGRAGGVAVIRICKDLSLIDRWDAFCHEYAHAINDIKLAKGAGGETSTQAIGSAIHQLMQAMGAP